MMALGEFFDKLKIIVKLSSEIDYHFFAFVSLSLKEDTELSSMSKAFILALWIETTCGTFDTRYTFNSKKSTILPIQINSRYDWIKMEQLLRKYQPNSCVNYLDGFLVRNPTLSLSEFWISFYVVLYSLLEGTFNKNGYGIEFYLNKHMPNYRRAIECIGEEYNSEIGKSVASSAKLIKPLVNEFCK